VKLIKIQSLTMPICALGSVEQDKNTLKICLVDKRVRKKKKKKKKKKSESIKSQIRSKLGRQKETSQPRAR
jgi:hypothetical protein